MEGTDVKKTVVTLALLLVLSGLLVSLPSFNAANAAVNNSYAWGTFQADAERIGYTESPAPDGNQTFWKFRTGGAITASPVAAAGLVFVGSSDGYLYAVNATTGEKVWNFWIGEGINSPTVADGKVFVCLSDLADRAGIILTGSRTARGIVWAGLVLPQLHMNADDVVSVFLQQSGSH